MSFYTGVTRVVSVALSNLMSVLCGQYGCFSIEVWYQIGSRIQRAEEKQSRKAATFCGLLHNPSNVKQRDPSERDGLLAIAAVPIPISCAQGNHVSFGHKLHLLKRLSTYTAVRILPPKMALVQIIDRCIVMVMGIEAYESCKSPSVFGVYSCRRRKQSVVSCQGQPWVGS
jgi:hypothetical protein